LPFWCITKMLFFALSFELAPPPPPHPSCQQLTWAKPLLAERRKTKREE
jgi:hypothetical protein